MLTTKWWRFDINDLAGVSFDNPTAALDEIIRREEVGDVQEVPYQYKQVRVYTKGYHSLVETPQEEVFE